MSDPNGEAAAAELSAAIEGTDNGTKVKAREKKSRWRDIERITRRLRLIRDLKEINPEFDPYSHDEFMQF